MFRKKRFGGGHKLVPCMSCNFSAVVLDFGNRIQVIGCLCVKDKEK
jgi:hypothetical protein